MSNGLLDLRHSSEAMLNGNLNPGPSCFGEKSIHLHSRNAQEIGGLLLGVSGNMIKPRRSDDLLRIALSVVGPVHSRDPKIPNGPELPRP